MTGLLIAILIFVVFLALAVILFFLFSHQLRKTVFTSLMKRLRFSKNETMKDIKSLAEQLTDALIRLSEDRIGALITIERRDPLNEYRDIGFKLTCKFSPELIFSILYNKKSPLHDGAIIVKDSQIVSVSSYYPTSNQQIDINYGARHRAALGLSEITDAITYVVSESSGAMSVAQGGKLTALPEDAKALKVAIVGTLLAISDSTKKGG